MIEGLQLHSSDASGNSNAFATCRCFTIAPSIDVWDGRITRVQTVEEPRVRWEKVDCDGEYLLYDSTLCIEIHHKPVCDL